MTLFQLRIGDQFSYYGVDYEVHDIHPPFVYIQRSLGDGQVRKVEFLDLVTDRSFNLQGFSKKVIEKKIKKEDEKFIAYLDNLSDKEREEVALKFEMIKPVLIFDKAKQNDLKSILHFNDAYKEYLHEEENIQWLTKEKLLHRISNKYSKSVRQLKRYLAAYYKEENEMTNQGRNGLIRKTALSKTVRNDELMIEICHPKKKEKILDVIYIRKPKEYIPIVKEAIEKHYLTKRKPSIKYVKEIIDVLCYKADLEPIDYDTVYHIIKKRLNPRLRDIMRHGEEALNDYIGSVGGFSEVAKAPLHIVEIDHTQLDMDVIDEQSGANLGRPWITLGIDVFTRMIWCMHISFDSPSADKVRKALLHGIFFKKSKETHNTINNWDISGIPAKIYFDNGSEFKNAEVKRMVEEVLQSQIMYRPVATPRYGGIIERVLGTINKEFIHNLFGNRKSNPTELGDYDAEKEAIFTLADIEELLTRYIVDVYHHDIHTGLPLEYPTPSARYYHALDIMGFPDFILPEDEGYYRMEMLPTKLKMYTREGIRDGNSIYSSHETSKFINKLKLKYKIKYDPDDISFIYILDPSTSRYIEVPSQRPSADEVKGMNRKVYNMILKVLRENGRINRQQIPGSREIVEAKAMLFDRMNEMIKTNKSIRQKALKAGFVLSPKVPQITQGKSSKSRIEELRDKLNYEKHNRSNGV